MMSLIDVFNFIKHLLHTSVEIFAAFVIGVAVGGFAFWYVRKLFLNRELEKVRRKHRDGESTIRVLREELNKANQSVKALEAQIAPLRATLAERDRELREATDQQT